MKVEVLGSGGALSIPKPLCRCRVCAEAREKGVPYTRTGPAIFVHGPDVLIDTPEEIKQQLNRSTVTEIAGCFYSHWHPDHVMGCRVWDMNADFRSWPRRACGTTPIYLPEGVAADFRVRLGLWEHLSFLAERGWVELVELVDGDSVTLDRTTIRPFRVAENYVYAFLFEAGGKRLLVAPDELKGWSPPAELRALDLAVIPMGIVEFDPFSGARRIHPDHPVLRFEATFEETLAVVERLEAKRVVLTHIEEMDALSYDDLLRLERKLDHRVTFAYDTMLVDV
jgi:phosphoribosyl 1,2-cyclic phosphate phosphodiesterase